MTSTPASRCAYIWVRLNGDSEGREKWYPNGQWRTEAELVLFLERHTKAFAKEFWNRHTPAAFVPPASEERR
jgi:hypothetical protein